MSHSDHKRKLNKRDLIVGALLLVTGVAALWQAIEFDDASRMFPLVVASLLAVTGVGIVIGSILKPMNSHHAPQRLSGVFLAALIIAAWAAALAGGAGFLLPTFAMQTLLLWLTGVRPPIYIIGIAAIVAVLAYLLFVVLLDIPLPPSNLPAFLQGF